MFSIFQIGLVYMKLGSRNLLFWTSATNLTLIMKTPGVLLIGRDVVCY